jgi:anthranilate phosphoribosyltransferase
MVVHGADGMDELTVFAKNHVAELQNGTLREFTLDPAELGLAHTDRAAVAGGSPQENAARIRAIFAGEKGPSRDIVVLNAAAALVVAGVAPDPQSGVVRAQQAIDSGDAGRKLGELAAFRG